MPSYNQTVAKMKKNILAIYTPEFDGVDLSKIIVYVYLRPDKWVTM